MIKSMSGFGQGTAQLKNGMCTISVRALNSRYLDIKLSGIEGYPDLDHLIRNKITEKLERGSIQLNVNLNFGMNGKSHFQFNQERFELIDKILSTIKKKYGRHMNMADIITSKDLFMDGPEMEIDSSEILTAINLALSQVDSMRIKEGEKTAEHLASLLNEIADLVEVLKEKTKKIIEKKINKYREKIQDLINGIPVEESRLSMEIMILADKTDVSEELSRSLSHIDQFRQLMKLDEPVGKRLNFLTQELNREVNTLGVKAADVTVSRDVIDLKSGIEKIREQIQNIL
ncbi:MAG: YicC family protein [Candidatus Marinimicrobia bacterium]|nr:YicC family protein [Candidatus Neomarinimicrobiota bacterium]MEC7926767.1 YicC/YloC family endoribonuclease [Candidatus Neomarinimicrobiota bacterium]|tara:strand:+ start:1742 stop:2605 length:864 start_codon:yes stop_codon:yes gene_type:complete